MEGAGSVFLIPSYLSENNGPDFLAPMVLEVVKNTQYFMVENVRTARRFISSLKLGIDISSLHFEILDKKSTYDQIYELSEPLLAGNNIGIISEAGLPGLADPGHLMVGFAHQTRIKIIPLPGASSIQTAVIASGFSGQKFTFHGYIPIQKAERIKTIKNLETQANKTRYTQVFMETPFRNKSLFDDLMKTLNPHTQLHISSDLFGAKQYCKTLSVQQWKKEKPDIHKIPTVFCIGQIA